MARRGRDFGSGDPPVVAPADRRFRRAKVKPVRRRKAGIRWFPVVRAVVLVLVFGYGSYRLASLATGTPVLQVNHIVIRGNERLSNGEILGVLDGLRGSNILRTRLGIWRRRLMTSSWVRDAALRRVLPSTVEVAISERRPMGLARLGSALYLLDADGTIIDEYGAQYSQFDLPIIDGLAAVPRDGAAAIDEARVGLASRLLDSVGQDADLVKRISQIDVRDAHDAIVLLDGDAALIHLGEEQFIDRLRSYVELASALRARVPEIDYVDLRFGERVYVRPTGGAGRTGGPAALPAAATRGRRRF